MIKEHTQPQRDEWVEAITLIARHYRQSFSPGALDAAIPWLSEQSLPIKLQHLSRLAGLKFTLLDQSEKLISGLRLPLVAMLNNGSVVVIESFDGEDCVGVRFMEEGGLVSQISITELLTQTESVVAFRPIAPVKDSRTVQYFSTYTPDWLKKLIIKDLKPYLHVMLASFVINLLALSGILFSMQVYDRVIPAQSYPTLYVLFGGVMISVIFMFILKLARGHITDLLAKRADIRVSDRVFGHALRLKNSAIPRSTGSFIAQVREIEQIREMVTSRTVSILVDLPFFLLFQLVLVIVSPWLSWIAPIAVIIMLVPGLLYQKKLARLAQQNLQEVTLRNAILVESLQGIQDIKLMQAESRFLQQWNSYISITAESGVKTRQLTHSLVAWGTTIQSLVYAAVVVVGAPLVISGDITTGAMVAASMLSTRMIAPMTALCGVLARWQQVKVAKRSLDQLMALPVEDHPDEMKVHRALLHGNYELHQASFSYGQEHDVIPLQVNKLTIAAGEKIALLGRMGAGKSTLLQALSGNLEKVSGQVRLDDLSLEHIDMADIRRNIGLLTQEARLFHGTIRDNLILGRPNSDDEEIFEVLAITGAIDFIRQLPLGLEHPIMEGGTGLSGGQRQSLLLSRTLLRDPNIVLLDEPTASFDEPSEKHFIERLEQWIGHRTLIIATHRAAILSLTERVIVLKEGRIAMDTSREELFKTKGKETSPQGAAL
ncbi:type I secretion system permease/ATPase [Rosenbergiella collisarenosi]|uniref:type I secretion system permease/ATPase n=1 Tax=Rosenbergiella collisarenosi TaxID=1544695 RepID=UPI001F4E52A6|nr:type I secretion system permease/ATPase [Rosenbergiella collisarenosi]